MQKNMNALHYVALRGFNREASLLLEAGINRDAVDNVSNSPCGACLGSEDVETVANISVGTTVQGLKFYQFNISFLNPRDRFIV